MACSKTAPNRANRAISLFAIEDSAFVYVGTQHSALSTCAQHSALGRPCPHVSGAHGTQKLGQTDKLGQSETFIRFLLKTESSTAAWGRLAARSPACPGRRANPRTERPRSRSAVASSPLDGAGTVLRKLN
jgi:hypothetical protein